MRRAGGAWAVILCVAAAGCVSGPFTFLQPDPPAIPRSQSPYAVGGFGNTFGNALALDSAPGLYVESVLFERPVGDALLNRDLWLADISGLSPTTRVLLEENGVRVAVLGGNLPAGFLKLLETGEGAVKPQGLTFGARTEAVLSTVGPIVNCEYEVLTSLSDERSIKNLQSAHGGFRIQPERMADGRVTVHCEPQIQHGEQRDRLQPGSDGSGFTLQTESQLERYPTLGFDVVLAPGEYLVIGWPAAMDRAESRPRDTLGSTLFCVEAKGEVHQRVLVMRAGYRGADRPDRPDASRPGGVDPIARRANRWRG